MIKKVGLDVILLLQTLFGYVQNIPAYGVLNTDEGKITDCDFDKNAEALTLFDMGKFACFFQGIL